MVKKEKIPTYFDERQKHTIVENFSVSWANHTTWIRNEPIYVIDWSSINAPLTDHRVIVVGSTAYGMSDTLNSWVKAKNILIKHGDTISNDWTKELETKGILFTSQVPSSIEWLESILSRATPADDMPKQIDELVKKYTGAIKVTELEKLQVKEELYVKIMTLKIEGRILGEFKLEPLFEQRMTMLDNKLENLSQRIDNDRKLIAQINNNIEHLNQAVTDLKDNLPNLPKGRPKLR